MRNVTTVLFDLGGVLIKLGPFSEMMATSPISDKDIWKGWIQSSSVRCCESGGCTSQEFAENMVAEFNLSINATGFIERFQQWPKRAYPGAHSLRETLSRKFRLASLSKTNPTHWEDFLCDQKIMTCFSDVYLSHQKGNLKSEAAAFIHVLDHLGLSTEAILFFDDNPMHVSAAEKMGRNAKCTKTP